MKAPLGVGDEVAVVAPASPLPKRDQHWYPKGLELLAQWGLTVTHEPIITPHPYLAGTDQQRQQHWQQVSVDAGVKAVFALRGGYGCLRIVDQLCQQPPCLVGFSDITTLHLARLTQGLLSFHGPNLATAQLLDDTAAGEANRQSLYNWLFSDDYRPFYPTQFHRSGTGQGCLVGGCLTLLAADLGGLRAFNPTGCVLFIEEIGENAYRLDRLLTQLHRAGWFKQLQGLVFGDVSPCTSKDVLAIITPWLDQWSFPVATHLPCGHGVDNRTLALGQTVQLCSRQGGLRFL